MRKAIILSLAILSTLLLTGQTKQAQHNCRVIIDNDFGGDPDGLFDLAHQLISPSTDVRAIIASAHHPVYPPHNDPAGKAMEDATNLLEVMGLKEQFKVFRGSSNTMTIDKPEESEGARVIISEAMRTDTDIPLYVLCGGGLTTIASAWLMEPEIADKLTIIWIGGNTYGSTSESAEHNLNISIPSAQVVFNLSNMRIWQVPKDAYDQTVMSVAEMKANVAPHGELGKYLVDKILERMNYLSGYFNGETYTMGDNPLTLLTALQAFYGKSPTSSESEIRKAPIISEKGLNIENPKGRDISVFTRLDTRLMFEDFIAKIVLYNQTNTKEYSK
ncbi:MAG: nucleoside hydrolase [Cyclobacteriaceae bacterium]|nr:nucleoside hydrolase [Cyclobacteriaceae bacterium SS2]